VVVLVGVLMSWWWVLRWFVDGLMWFTLTWIWWFFWLVWVGVSFGFCGVVVVG